MVETKKYRSHFSQTDSAGEVTVVDGMICWKVDDPRSPTLHGRTDITMGAAQYVKGWWGDPVLTNTGLLTFITAMERLVAQFPGKAINCTEGGCHLEGTRRMFLADALAEHCKEPIDKSVLHPLLSLHPKADERVDAAIPALQKDIKLLNMIIEQADKGMATTIKLRNTTKEAKVRKLLVDNAKHSTAAQQGALKIPPLNLALYAARKRIQTRELNVSQDLEHLIKNRKDLITRLDRNDVILKAARDAAKDLRQTYINTEVMLAAYVRERPYGTLLDPTGELTPPNLSDAGHYLSSGNFAKPLLEAQRVLADPDASRDETENAWEVAQIAYQERWKRVEAAKEAQKKDYAEKRNLIPQYLDLIDDSRRLGKADDMEGALGKLREAIALFPAKESARWGLASSLLHLERYEECLIEYGKLAVDFPANNRFLFEYGQALILGGRAQDGLAKIREAMSRTEEFDHFFGALARLYAENGLIEEAKITAEQHLKKHPYDKEVKELLERLKGTK